MANFAVAASNETIERANHIMDTYAQDGDKKEDTLLRILAVAEKELVIGTHPELEKNLRSVDGTIDTLIKQINGIVAGQDNQIQDLKEKLEKAIAEKNNAIEKAKLQMEDAQKKSEAAEVEVKQAQKAIDEAKTQADTDIRSIQKEADVAVERANMERDQAVRERDDARTIAAEKTASNELLVKQMEAMVSDLQDYKELQLKYDTLAVDNAAIQSKVADRERELDVQKKEYTAAQKAAEASKKAMELDFARRMETVKAQEELAIEKAVIGKEREIRSEYESQLRQADKENAILTAKITQMQEELDKLNSKLKKAE